MPQEIFQKITEFAEKTALDKYNEVSVSDDGERFSMMAGPDKDYLITMQLIKRGE